MKKKKVIIPIVILLVIVVIGVVAFFLLNNSKEYNPSESGFYMKQDGSIVGATIEKFDKDSYSLEDLTSYVEQEVSQFNNEQVGDSRAYLDEDKEGDSLPVSIQSLNLKGENAVLMLLYKDADTYREFNENEGLVSDLSFSKVGDTTGITSRTFKNMQGNTVKGSALNSNDYVIKIKGKVALECEGNVVYYSSGVSVNDEKISVDSENEAAYIIFEK